MIEAIRKKISDRTAVVGVIGLGYVGLPLAHALWHAGFKVLGFDIDAQKIAKIRSAETYIKHFPSETLAAMTASGRFRATGDFAELSEIDAILICVPTPLGRTREPDLSFVINTAESIADHLARPCLIVLESTTYPGTTDEVVQPIIQAAGKRLGEDFLLAFSPEREDPGSGVETRTIPKIVGGVDAPSGEVAADLYNAAFEKVHRVSNARAAEAVKITENVFRAVNIALVNELKLTYASMDIDVWEIIEAAKTKPFGFMAFYPGPGLGGHCIPIDPFYLSWRAKAFDRDTKFIELAGEINRAMPQVVVQSTIEALSQRFAKAPNGAKILVVGIAYKKNVDDLRESPALRIMEILKSMGADVSYYDPYFPQIPPTREHAALTGLEGVAFDKPTMSSFDAAIIATDHDTVDYASLVSWLPLVVDTRNATKGLAPRPANIVMA